MNKPDELLTFTEAAKLIPGRPHASTLWRWARKGIRGVRLETRRYGWRYFVSKSALDNFAARLGALPADDSPVESRPPLAIKPKRTPAERKAAVENATHAFD